MSIQGKKIQRIQKKPKYIKSVLSKIQNKFNKHCEYWRNCPLFDIESHQCCNSGGSYCGKFRNNREEPAKKLEIFVK